MARAFISYSREDFAIAELLRLKLGAEAIDTFVDTEGIEGGSEWRGSIDAEIEASDVLVVAVTDHSLDSDYVQFEWAFAVGRHIRVLPLLFGAVTLSGPLSRYQGIDCTKLQAVDWGEIAQIVRACAESKRAKEAERTAAEDLQSEVQKLDTVIQTLLNIPGLAESIDDLKSKLDVFRAQSRSIGVEAHRIFKDLLWVDDYPSNNVYEQEMCRKLNFRITTALSTDEAMELIERDPARFDLIISDMGRKEGPFAGFDLLEKLRARGIQTPFVIYAGVRGVQRREEAMRLGAQGATNDPVELRNLVVELV